MNTRAWAFFAAALALDGPAARARDGDFRQDPALEPLSGAALYRIDGTQTELRLESQGRRAVAAFARKATPSYYWGLRFRPGRPEAEYAYKILDKLVLGTSLGYHAYHPGALIKTEWYEAGGSVDYRVEGGALSRATILHASYFPSRTAAVGMITRHDGTTGVTVSAQSGAGAFVNTAAATRHEKKLSGKLMSYLVLDEGWRPGLGLTFADRPGVVAALNKLCR